MTKAPKIAKAQGRSVHEWIGKTPDAMPPATVMARIWDREKGICRLTGLPIGKKPWDRIHIKAIEDGGENRETNIALGLRSAHRKETGKENSRRAEADRKRMADIGANPPPQHPIESRGFPRTGKPERHARAPAVGLSEIARRYGLKP
jgi:5-methylcytosine-specific restriction enzyme A